VGELSFTGEMLSPKSQSCFLISFKVRKPIRALGTLVMEMTLGNLERKQGKGKQEEEGNKK